MSPPEEGEEPTQNLKRSRNREKAVLKRVGGGGGVGVGAEVQGKTKQPAGNKEKILPDFTRILSRKGREVGSEE